MNKDKKLERKKLRRNPKRKLNFVISILFSIAFLIFFDVFFRETLCSGVDINFKGLLFSLFLWSLIYCFILGISRRVHVATLILGIILNLVTIGNYVKIYYTNDPLLFTDIKYLGDMGEILNIAESSILFKLVVLFLPIVIFSVIQITLDFISFRYKYKIKHLFRLPLIVLPIIFCIILLNPPTSLKNRIQADIFNIKGTPEDKIYVSVSKHYGAHGVLSGMYSHYLENMIEEPAGYDIEQIKKTLGETKRVTDTFLGTPNVIVFFAESFWNIDRVEELKFDKEINPNFNRLKEEGIYFEMISPSFASVSGNVEFEFLTGANMSYFGYGYVPYTFLYTNNNYYNVPSIIHELNNNDYFTKIVAYTGPALFNCGKFYTYAGVDETVFNYELAELNRYYPEEWKKGNQISDDHVVDEIIEEFNNKEKGKREFYMTLSMQAHSPYYLGKYDTYDISLVESPTDETLLNEAILSYAQGIYDTDKALGRLYDYIKTLDEPTIIVFYGDHLPQVSGTTNNLLNTLEFFNTESETLNLFRKYNTQALLLANFELPKEDYKYISPDLLSTYMLNHMDIDLSAYYRWTYTQIKDLPAMNQYIGINQDSEIYFINNMKKEMLDAYEIRKKIQYYYFINDYQK